MGNSGSAQDDTIWKACTARQKRQIIELSASKEPFLRPPAGTNPTAEHFGFDTNYEDVLDLERADSNLARRKAELVPTSVSVR